MHKPDKNQAKIIALGVATAALVALAAWIALLPGGRKGLEARFGNREAQYELARQFADGAGVAENHDLAIEWFRKSAEKGHVQSCLTMARLYFTGDGVGKSDAEGVKWLQKAAENGSSFAQAMMGLLYMGGIGVEQSIDQSVKWLAQSRELEAEMMMKDLQRNVERIDALPQEEREAALEAFYARKKLYTGELFAKLMNKMQKHEYQPKEGEE